MPLTLTRTLVLLISLLSLFCLFLYVSLTNISPSSSSRNRQSATNFLFPSTAIISLSDDNSTFFLSRPAAFGPPLPKSGLKGELFVLEEGQLACDDTPGWDPSSSPPVPMIGEDGTDDFDYAPESSVATVAKSGGAHADIESLQQSAEIEGKIVLVARGGCGFLEKVLWAQRRGGVALIVGDYKRSGGTIGGGALVTMYAKGDTSNITIPSIFTTYTTAKLLTTLLPKHVSLPFRRPNTPGPVAGPEPKSGEERKNEEGEEVGLRAKWPLEKRDQTPPELQAAGTTTRKSRKTTITTSIGSTATPTSPSAGSNIHVDSSHRPPMSGELDGIVFVVSPDEGKPGDENGDKGGDKDSDAEKDGLWIILTPTSMSTSPFFDTLLVLVISPLVTLTIVYALLLARSVIRRRRWRAPKSVVERLPVRTYHSTPSTSIPQTPPHPQRMSSLPPRNNRERNVSNASSSRSISAPGAPEKQNKEYIHQSPPRSGYQGGSVECVVCLEEYVDGVSRVMKLPCGHEFHAGCITPWLTTRRRTCPICKDDVVRGAAAGGPGPSWGQHSDVGEASERTPLVTEDYEEV
ncbi:hypothetical protein L873DRAFT_1721302 [Choiromyces venosus 120613-1]|uniref:RING-type domain-containing protein n=1 Tax=Choiromyces venosus 120613-1 TaxID=1336337 RepID=A0A3N4J6P8_9PEZI|nr:hypothetical protein L873DRAFT_1721302 [Choiromyces venosus 120613-1]